MNINDNKLLALKYMAEHSSKVSTDIDMNHTNKNEVRLIIKKMEVKRSYGYDEIPITIIKDNVDILAEPLSIFLNNCIDQGIFPDQLKIARVLPIHKKGKKNDPKNFRPISLLPVISKLYEKLIKDRIVTHLNQHKILNERQFGYQMRLGTMDAVDLLIKEVLDNLNSKFKVAGLFLDLSSAFDTVDHEILLAKLEFYGIRGTALSIVRSYLNNRKQFVEIKNIVKGLEIVNTSKLVSVRRGVPQGSILGPIFFLIFLNDLISYISNTIPGIKLVVYADDTNAIIPAKNIQDLKVKIDNALVAFNNWFCVNNLKLNIAKTSAILFRSTAREQDIIQTFSNGVKVVFVDSVKFLGVHIDQFLNWKPELEAIENAISSACYALRSLRDEVSMEQLKTTYYALVESKLRYSVKFWGNSYDYNMNRAFTIQKRAIRTMVRIPPWESCRNHFMELHILTLPSLYILVTLMDIIRHPSKYETQEQRATRLDTRRKDLATPLCPKLNIVRHGCRYQAVTLYNSLPVAMKIIESPTTFKSALIKLLLEGCFYTVDDFKLRKM